VLADDCKVVLRYGLFWPSTFRYNRDLPSIDLSSDYKKARSFLCSFGNTRPFLDWKAWQLHYLLSGKCSSNTRPELLSNFQLAYLFSKLASQARISDALN